MQPARAISEHKRTMPQHGLGLAHYGPFPSKNTTCAFDVIISKQIGYSHYSDCTFTGKERDEETGYGYFGARYMDHELMTMWLSVDPMADKYPGISPYAYCAWNPIKLVDPDGREWDPATEKDVISPYRAEVRKRMSMIEKKRNREGNPNLYQDQYFEYQSILQELDDLENDRSHIYKVIFDRDEPNDGVVNLGRKQDDKCIINITIKLKASSIKGNSFFRHLEVISHELKHAYQFFQGRLGFVIDMDGNQISSTNMQILEKEAFTRGDMFLSHNVTNGQSMKYDYNLDAESYELNENYSLMSPDSYIVPENASIYWHPNHK